MTNPIMKHFQYEHLPARLQVISKQFHTLAWAMETGLPDGPEKSVALRKILEGKDAAVRSALHPEPKNIGTVEETTIVDFSGVERAMKREAADQAIADLAKDMDVPPHSTEGWEPLR